MTATPFKYWAFISYSHQDETWAQWLHRSLETWRVPRRLVGRALGEETVPRRLFPVFRDRDELPSSHELGAVINRALAQSRNLIVVCSPRAATSRWVNEEIKAFRALGRSERVFCLIVDGEPNASVDPAHAFSECFPPALRTEGFEPIAADARSRKDGKAGAKLKLLSGLINVGLDELKQREKQRKFWQRVQMSAAAAVVVAMLAGTWQWFAQQRAEREHEILVEKLVESGRAELLDGRNARAAVYLTEALKLGEDTVPLRFMLARAMAPVDALTDMRIRHGGGPVRRAVFSADGKRFALVVRTQVNAVAEIYDAATGQQLATFPDVAEVPNVVTFLRGGDALFVNGLWSESTRGDPRTGIWRIGRSEPVVMLSGAPAPAGSPLSPDGTVLLHPADTGGGVSTIDTATGRVTGRLGPAREVAAASFSGDGRSIAIVETNGSVSLWAANGRHIADLPGTRGESLSSVVFMPDGLHVVAMSTGGTVRQWDVPQRTLTVAFAADYKRLYQARISADARRLLTIGSEGYRVWNAARGALLLSVEAPLDEWSDATLSGDGNLLYTADHVSSVSDVWDIQSKRRLYTYDVHTNAVTAVALDPTGAYLLLAGADGHAELLAAQVTPWWRAQSLEFNPGSVRFSRDGQRLFTAGARGTEGFVQVHDLATRSVVMNSELYPAFLYDASLSDDESLVAAAGGDGSAVLFDSNGRVTSVVPSLSTPLQHALINRNRVLVKPWYTGPVEQAIARLWSISEARVVGDLTHAGGIHSAQFAPDGKFVATGDDSGEIWLWRASDGSLVRELEVHSGAVHSVEISRDGKSILSTSADQSVRVTDLDSGTVRSMLSDETIGVPFIATLSPDGRTVAVGTSTGARVWEPETGTTKSLHGPSDVVRLRFVQDGRILLTGSLDGTVWAWDTDRASSLGIVATHVTHITGLDVSADERRLATADFQWVFAVWDVGIDARSVTELSRAITCKVPWRLNGMTLAPAVLDPAACEEPQGAGAMSAPSG